MDWLTRLLTVGAKRLDSPERFFASTVTTGDETSSQYHSAAKARSSELVKRCQQWAMICTQRRAEAAASVPIRLYVKGRASAGRKWARPVTDRTKMRRLADPVNGPGRKAAMYAEYAGNVEEVTDHPLLSALSSPNPWQTGTEWSQSAFASAYLTGNRFAQVVMPDKQTIELYTMLPQNTWIRVSRENFIDGYGYGRDGSIEDWFDLDEVIHGKHFPSPWNPYYGVGCLHAVFAELDIDAARTTGEAAMWRNGARPDYAVELPEGTNVDQKKQIEADINRMHQGPHKRGRFLLLTGSKIQPLQFTPKEMEYIAGTENIERRIFAAFGMPESQLKLNDSNLASSVSGNIQFARWTIKRDADQFAEELTCKLLPMVGIEPGEMWFAADSPVVEDKAVAAAVHSQYVGAGVLSINEVRNELGFDAIEGGDEPRVGGRGLNEPPPSPFGFGGFGRSEPDREVDQAERAGNAAVKALRCKHDHHVKTTTDGFAGPPAEAMMEEAPASIAEDRADDMSPSIRNLDRTVREWFEGLPAGSLQYGPDGAPDLRPFTGDLIDRIRPHLRRFLEAGIQQGAGELRMAGVDPSDVTPDRAFQFLDQYTIRLAGGITQTTQDSLKEALKRGAVDGTGAAIDRSVLVAQALKDESGYRAERIARTETTRMFTEGNIMAWRESGTEEVEFILSAEPCAECAAYAAANPGPIPIARSTGVIPIHPSCRCAWVPVVNIGGDE